MRVKVIRKPHPRGRAHWDGMTTSPRTATSTNALAEFAAGLRIDDVPPAVLDSTKQVFLDALACAYAGRSDPQASRVALTAGRLMGNGDSTIIGAGRGSLAGGTLCNAFLVTAASLCDIHHPTACHVSPEVVPPALAVAEQCGTSGATLLAAIVAGLETTIRVAIGLDPPTFRSLGWHMPGVAGVIGSAAAAGRARRLRSRQMIHAFGIAGSQAAGTDAQHGTPTIKFHQARAALAGVVGADLASRGFTSMPDVLTHATGGIFATHARGGRPDLCLDGLGDQWRLSELSLRPWPLPTLELNIAGVVLELAGQHSLNATMVDRVTLILSLEAERQHGQDLLNEGIATRSSARVVAAVALLDGQCSVAQLTPERLADPAVTEFAASRIVVTADPSFPPRAVAVDCQLRDGTHLTHSRQAALGEPEDPLGQAAIEAKFREHASKVLSDGAVSQIIDRVMTMEHQRSVGPFIRSLGVPPA